MRTRILLILTALVLITATALPAIADRGGVVRFATLPKPGPGFPEGIAADVAGDIYVATFDFNVANVIYVFRNTSGHLLTTIPLPSGVVPLGLAFDAAGNLWVADFANGHVLEFAPPFGPGSVPTQTIGVCGGSGAGCALNAIAFDANGDLFVSDSFDGNVFKIDLPAGTVSTFVSSILLTPGGGFPPFGANGLAFDAAGANLFIANTATDSVLRYNIAAAMLTVFAANINGADGIAFAGDGRLWVAANQGDEVVALDATGAVVARRGSFEGVGPGGAPRGLLFPASIVIARGSLYVTNLAIALTPTLGASQKS